MTEAQDRARRNLYRKNNEAELRNAARALARTDKNKYPGVYEKLVKRVEDLKRRNPK